MSRKRKSNVETDIGQPDTIEGKGISLFARRNRGILLDVFVFIINIFLMRSLSSRFISLVQEASDGSGIAEFTLFLFCLGIFLLPPLGATLKRRHFHRRLRLKGKTTALPEDFFGGCLFNPISYFCLNVVILCTLTAFVLQFIYGDKEPDGSVFVSSILLGIVFNIFQTTIVYRYFSPPKTEPRAPFLQDPRSEIFGDACIYLNMILFQLIWNVLTLAQFDRVSGVGDFLGRLFFLSFAALLVYFPPRIFYLAEDIKRPRAWLTILLANSPVIFRIMWGTNAERMW